MFQWCMAHPWMTFFLVALAMMLIDNIITNLVSLVNNIARLRYYKKSMEDQEDGNE